MKAVQFGAGNIGRGFVGVLLHEAGYEVVFSDVAPGLVADIDAADAYTVHEVGEGGRDIEVTGFRAIDSAADPDAVAREIATADVVTTAVGPNVLRLIAPLIFAGLRERDPASAPVAVMACENAIGATDTLRDAVRSAAGDDWTAVADRAVWANTAVDRIVPVQPADGGIDVTVEPFFEWAVERPPFGDRVPRIPGAHFVEDLEPYIERKLFTVNTGHAATAYFGAAVGIERISDALADPGIRGRVAAVLSETGALLAAKHELDPRGLAEYRSAILRRFENPALPDTVQRVGRQPLRKLSRHERFIGPAAECAERSLEIDALLGAIAAALMFDDAADEQSVELQEVLHTLDADAAVEAIAGLETTHPLFPQIVDLVRTRQAGL